MKNWKSKIWCYLAISVCVVTLMTSCATYGTFKEKVLPSWRDSLVATGPDLFRSLLVDLSSLLNWPTEQVESIFGFDKKEKPKPSEK